MYDLADASEQIFAYMVVSLTNAKRLQGESGRIVDEIDEYDLERGEWLEFGEEAFGFQDRYWKTDDSGYYKGGFIGKQQSVLGTESGSCEAYACTLKLSRPLDAEPKIVPGEALFFSSKSYTSVTKQDEILYGDFKKIIIIR